MEWQSGQRPLDPHRTITIVSGLPRAGTSMMMQMLAAAGFPLASDESRAADVDNPRGYFELDAVRRLPRDDTFLKEAIGRVVKIVSPLLRFLPADYDYRVIFMERDLAELLASQRAMLVRRGGELESPAGVDADDETMERAFTHQLRDVREWMAERENIRTRFVSHALVLDSAVEASERIVTFLESTGGLASNAGREDSRSQAIERMAAVVDAELHRQRAGDAPGATD